MSKAVSRAHKPRKRAATPARRPKTPRLAEKGRGGPPRGVIVGLMLFGGLGLTSLLLSLLSPSPLAPDVFGRLYASEDTTTFDRVFSGVQPGRWTGIYIHHSKTPGGDASTLADRARAAGASGPPDHFIIGNGDGMLDGEVQVTHRWAEQLPAGPPVAGVPIEPSWISICLIGDFDRNRPTGAQRQRLEQLVLEIESRLGIGRDRLTYLERPDSAAGIGRRFAE